MKTAPLFTNCISSFAWRFALLLILLLIGCFGLLPNAQAVNPPPDGDYPDGNTAEGHNALLSLTTGLDNTAMGLRALSDNTSGVFNTAVGAQALFHNATSSFNTATGSFALGSNTNGGYNTAVGYAALTANSTGANNTAAGVEALFHNTVGLNNTATGGFALFENTTGYGNTANGYFALYKNTTSNANTAIGDSALFKNTTGNNNTANGVQALYSNTTGGYNTADGYNALFSNTTGRHNIALGSSAGQNLTTGSFNIDIGNLGVGDESDTIRIGDVQQSAAYIAGIYGVSEGGVIAALYINSVGQLGTQPPPSSRRFKKEIKPMAETSEAILALKPVTFHYKKEIDPAGTQQFGLVAEDVEKVNSDLVVRDKQGKPYSVRYDAVNAMLLNEFLKEHRKVEQLEARLVQQEKDFTTRLMEQEAKIQQVSNKMELNKGAPRTVENN